MREFGALDWGVVVAYFALTIGVAWWAWRRERLERAAGNAVEDYFLASRNVGWFIVGPSPP